MQCEAPKIAKLVYNSNNYGLWYANNYSTGAYKPTYNWGASHCGIIDPSWQEYGLQTSALPWMGRWLLEAMPGWAGSFLTSTNQHMFFVHLYTHTRTHIQSYVYIYMNVIYVIYVYNYENHFF